MASGGVKGKADCAGVRLEHGQCFESERMTSGGVKGRDEGEQNSVPKGEKKSDMQERQKISEHLFASVPGPLSTSALVVMAAAVPDGFVINVIAGEDVKPSSVTTSGSVSGVISDLEFENLFPGNSLNGPRCNNGPVYSWVGTLFGKNPDDLFAHSSTPWGDLYATYGWPQVQSKLYISRAVVKSITAEPAVVAHEEFTNASSVEGTFTGGVSATVTNSSTTTYSQSNTIGVSEEVALSAEFLGEGAKSKTTLSYSHAWGESNTTTQSLALGSSSNVSVDLKPGQSVIADLTVSKGTMIIEVDYTQTIHGILALNYGKPFKDHHFWALDANSVLQSAGNPLSFTWTATIELGFYTNSHVQLKDA